MSSCLAAQLWQQINFRPEKPFWIGRDNSYSYGDLARSIEHACALFDRSNVDVGAILLIVKDDPWQAFVFWMAALLDGMIPANLANDISDGRLAGVAKLAKPGMILVDEKRLAPFIKAGVDAEILSTAKPDNGSLGGVRRSPSLTVQADDTAYILFTSGTTSNPKGVVITHSSLQSQLETIARVFEVTREARLFNGLILHHVDGLVQGPVLVAFSGATLLRPDPFAVSRLEDDLIWLRDSRATHMISVPSVYGMIDHLAARDDYFDRTEFHAMLSTSARLDSALWGRLESRFHKPVINEYGMTETVAATHFAGPHAEMGERFTSAYPIRASPGRYLPSE
ncbi:MAG: AMP-binding protein, partial [Pseudomonadota bacterium]